MVVPRRLQVSQDSGTPTTHSRVSGTTPATHSRVSGTRLREEKTPSGSIKTSLPAKEDEPSSYDDGKSVILCLLGSSVLTVHSVLVACM